MAYLDGELEPQRAAALAAHLEHCAACQEVAQGFRALSEKMLEFEVEPPSAHMNETVLAALDSAKLPATAERAAIDADTQVLELATSVCASAYAWAIAGAVTVRCDSVGCAYRACFGEHSIRYEWPSLRAAFKNRTWWSRIRAPAVNQTATSATELSEAWDAPRSASATSAW